MAEQHFALGYQSLGTCTEYFWNTALDFAGASLISTSSNKNFHMGMTLFLVLISYSLRTRLWQVQGAEQTTVPSTVSYCDSLFLVVQEVFFSNLAAVILEIRCKENTVTEHLCTQMFGGMNAAFFVSNEDHFLFLVRLNFICGMLFSPISLSSHFVVLILEQLQNTPHLL